MVSCALIGCVVRADDVWSLRVLCDSCAGDVESVVLWFWESFDDGVTRELVDWDVVVNGDEDLI